MFAHQVIEDLVGLEKIQPISNDAQMYIKIGTSFCDAIRKSQKFYLSEIEDLFEATKQYKGHKMFMNDMADIRLPYKRCWFDYICDDSDPKNHIPIEKQCPKRGMLVAEIKPKIIYAVLFNFMSFLKKWWLGPMSYIISIGHPSLEDPEIRTFAELATKAVGAVFKPTPKELESNIFPIPLMRLQSSDQVGQCVKEDIEDLGALNLALMLLSCKNIEAIKIEAPKKLNKKRIQAGKTEVFDYHVLKIKPVGKRQGSIPVNLWHNRIHLCRGHFKTYTAEKPLFGTIIGRFWWQAHVAGRNKSGVVLKDYEIKYANS